MAMKMLLDDWPRLLTSTWPMSVIMHYVASADDGHHNHLYRMTSSQAAQNG